MKTLLEVLDADVLNYDEIQQALNRLENERFKLNNALKETDNSGNTPLHLAVVSGNLDLINLLLSYSPPLECINHDAKKPEDLIGSVQEAQVASKIRALFKVHRFVQGESEKREINFHRTLFLIREAVLKMDSAHNTHPALLFFGMTGVGKSTRINVMHGCEYEAVQSDSGTDIVRLKSGSRAEVAKVGEGGSETKYPEIYSGTKFDMIDLPGVCDTRGREYQIVASLCTDLLSKKLKEIRALVLLVSEDLLNDGRINESLTKPFKEVARMIENRPDLNKNIILLVTKHKDWGVDRVIRKLSAMSKQADCPVVQGFLGGFIENGREKIVFSSPSNNELFLNEINSALDRCENRNVTEFNFSTYSETTEKFSVFIDEIFRERKKTEAQISELETWIAEFNSEGKKEKRHQAIISTLPEPCVDISESTTMSKLKSSQMLVLSRLQEFQLALSAKLRWIESDLIEYEKKLDQLCELNALKIAQDTYFAGLDSLIDNCCLKKPEPVAAPMASIGVFSSQIIETTKERLAVVNRFFKHLKCLPEFFPRAQSELPDNSDALVKQIEADNQRAQEDVSRIMRAIERLTLAREPEKPHGFANSSQVGGRVRQDACVSPVSSGGVQAGVARLSQLSSRSYDSANTSPTAAKKETPDLLHFALATKNNGSQVNCSSNTRQVVVKEGFHPEVGGNSVRQHIDALNRHSATVSSAVAASSSIYRSPVAKTAPTSPQSKVQEPGRYPYSR